MTRISTHYYASGLKHSSLDKKFDKFARIHQQFLKNKPIPREDVYKFIALVIAAVSLAFIIASVWERFHPKKKD